MNEIITNIKNLELETLQNLKSSKSQNTLRAYNADFRDLQNFVGKDLILCRQNLKYYHYT